MKSSVTRIGKKFIAAQLAFCMLFAILAASAMPVLAAMPEELFLSEEGEKPEFNYVALGASNVNGYGMHGYNFEFVYEAPFEKTKDNRYGYEMDTPGSYTTLISEALGAKYNVNLSQIATSSWRIEELHLLLDHEYWGDSYTDTWFYDTNGDGVSSNWYYGAAVFEWNARRDAGLEGYDHTPTSEELLYNLREAVREKVANADLVTIDIGMNNFGTYMLNLIAGGIFSNDLGTVDPEVDFYYEIAKEFVIEKIGEFVDEKQLPEAMLTRFADTLSYALVGYCINFDETLKEIYALNPDVTVVAVSIQNMMAGLNIKFAGSDLLIPFGEIFGTIVDAANTYVAAISPYSTKYYYADVNGDEGHTEFFMDEIREYNGDPSTLSVNIKDSLNVYDDSLFLETRVLQKYAVLMDQRGFLSLTEEQADTTTTAGLSAFHYGYHYDIEAGTNQPVITLNDGTPLKAFIKQGEAGLLSGAEKEAYDLYASMLSVGYDVAAEIMSQGAKAKTLDFAVIASMSQLGVSAVQIILSTFNVALEKVIADPTYTFDAENEYSDGFFETLSAEYGLSADVFDTMFAYAMRIQFGGTVFSHPNGNGYMTIKNEVLSAIENETYGIEVVIKKAIRKAVSLTEAYFDGAHEFVYNACDEAGYIDFVSESVAYAAAEIELLKEAVYEIGLTPAFEAAVIAELDAAIASLAKVKNALDADDLATFGGIKDTVFTMGNEAFVHLNNAVNMIKAIGTDAANALVGIADAFIEKWKNEYDAQIIEFAKYVEEKAEKYISLLNDKYGHLAAEAAEVIVSYVKKQLGELTPEKIAEIKEYVYNYLVENREEILDFIAEYGPYALEFINDHREIFMLSAGLLAVIFADDAVEFVMEHKEEIKQLIYYLIKEYGDEALELLKKTLASLGVYEMLEEKIEDFYNSVSTAEYTITEDSYYVAIGDSVGFSGSYAEKVSELLNVGYDVIEDKGFCISGEDGYFAGYEELLAEADLITVSYSYRTVFDYFVELVSSEEELAWAALLGEDAEVALEKALVTIEAKIAESAVGAENAALVAELVEKLLYANVSRFATYIDRVSALSALAPDAVIAVLGYYNELESLSLTVYGKEIKLGEYFNLLIAAANLEVIYTAFENDNVVYVSIKDTETIFEENVAEDPELDSIAGYLSAVVSGELAPSEDGHEYIAAQIMGALDVKIEITEECEHSYSSVCDEDCDICGELRNAEPHSYLNGCDADCNVCGEVREVADHVYTNDCDATCNECGAQREPSAHVFGEWVVEISPTLTAAGKKMRSCTVCGEVERAEVAKLTLAPVVEEKSGISAGAVALIVVSSVIVLGAGSFSVVWFGVQKKSFAQLKTLIRKALAKLKK